MSVARSRALSAEVRNEPQFACSFSSPSAAAVGTGSVTANAPYGVIRATNGATFTASFAVLTVNNSFVGANSAIVMSIARVNGTSAAGVEYHVMLGDERTSGATGISNGSFVLTAHKGTTSPTANFNVTEQFEIHFAVLNFAMIETLRSLFVPSTVSNSSTRINVSQAGGNTVTQDQPFGILSWKNDTAGTVGTATITLTNKYITANSTVLIFCGESSRDTSGNAYTQVIANATLITNGSLQIFLHTAVTSAVASFQANMATDIYYVIVDALPQQDNTSRVRNPKRGVTNAGANIALANNANSRTVTVNQPQGVVTYKNDTGSTASFDVVTVNNSFVTANSIVIMTIGFSASTGASTTGIMSLINTGQNARGATGVSNGQFKFTLHRFITSPTGSFANNEAWDIHFLVLN